MLDQYDHYGAVNYRRDGQYVLTLGGVPVIDPKTRAPMVLDLAPPSIITGSKYRNAGDLIPRGPPGALKAPPAKGVR